MLATTAAAQWQLNSEASALKFATVKNAAVTELHHFTSITGSVSGARIEIRVALASVETLIEVRNERMREMLFEVVRFPEALVVIDGGQLPLDAIAAGGMHGLDVPIEVSLHGVTQSMSTSVRTVSLDGRIIVFNDAPLLVRAADFGLEPGIEALREIAGLNAIDDVVPVTFTLVFERDASGRSSAPRPPRLGSHE